MKKNWSATRPDRTVSPGEAHRVGPATRVASPDRIVRTPPRWRGPMIPFPCPSCGKGLQVKEELAGNKLACPHCRQPLSVPTAPARQGAPAGREGPSDARTLPPRGPSEAPTLVRGPVVLTPSQADATTRVGWG